MTEFNPIPIAKLQEGFEECYKQIEIPCDSADILYKEKKFSIAVALLVLAREECAKLTLLLFCILENREISKKEWMSYTGGRGVHANKLVGMIKESQKTMTKLGPEKYNQMKDYFNKLKIPKTVRSFEETTSTNHKLFENLKILNNIKQDCFYLDWDKKDWNVITKRSKIQLKSLVYVLKTTTRSTLYGHKYMNLFNKFNTNRITDNELLRMKDYESKWIKAHHELRSKNGIKKLKLMHVVLEDYSNKMKK